MLICRTLWHDAANPDDGYFVERRLFAFVQLYGDVGEYHVWVTEELP